MRLKDKVVIITGAGSGMGRTTAIMAAQQGADLVLADINEEAINDVAIEIESLGKKTAKCIVDVCNYDNVQNMIDVAVNTFSKVDALVNCAGIFTSSPFVDLTEKDWDRMIDINLKGAFICTQKFIKQLIKQKTGGSVVFISSISGYVGFPKSAHYCASKGAVRQLSKTIALEFGSSNIRSNVVAPGFIETPMISSVLDDEDMSKQYIEQIPMGRFGKPSEIADAITFLISDQSSFCTGSELIVDGGQITHC